jgi:hypothetical protein
VGGHAIIDHLDENGRPTLEAFRLRDVDRGALSADIHREAAIAKLQQAQQQIRLQLFLAAIDIERMKFETEGRVWVRIDKPGDSHVSVIGCENPWAQQKLANIVEVE